MSGQVDSAICDSSSEILTSSREDKLSKSRKFLICFHGEHEMENKTLVTVCLLRGNIFP